MQRIFSFRALVLFGLILFGLCYTAESARAEPDAAEAPLPVGTFTEVFIYKESESQEKKLCVLESWHSDKVFEMQCEQEQMDGLALSASVTYSRAADGRMKVERVNASGLDTGWVYGFLTDPDACVFNTTRDSDERFQCPPEQKAALAGFAGEYFRIFYGEAENGAKYLDHTRRIPASDLTDVTVFYANPADSAQYLSRSVRVSINQIYDATMFYLPEESSPGRCTFDGDGTVDGGGSVTMRCNPELHELFSGYGEAVKLRYTTYAGVDNLVSYVEQEPYEEDPDHGEDYEHFLLSYEGYFDAHCNFTDEAGEALQLGCEQADREFFEAWPDKLFYVSFDDGSKEIVSYELCADAPDEPDELDEPDALDQPDEDDFDSARLRYVGYADGWCRFTDEDGEERRLLCEESEQGFFGAPGKLFHIPYYKDSKRILWDYVEEEEEAITADTRTVEGVEEAE